MKFQTHWKKKKSEELNIGNIVYTPTREFPWRVALTRKRFENIDRYRCWNPKVLIFWQLLRCENIFEVFTNGHSRFFFFYVLCSLIFSFGVITISAADTFLVKKFFSKFEKPGRKFHREFKRVFDKCRFELPNLSDYYRNAHLIISTIFHALRGVRKHKSQWNVSCAQLASATTLFSDTTCHMSHSTYRLISSWPICLEQHAFDFPTFFIFKTDPSVFSLRLVYTHT